MNQKDRLLTDIKSYVKETKWEDILNEHSVDVLDVRPENVFAYLHERKYG